MKEFKLRFLGDSVLREICTPITSYQDIPEGLVAFMEKVIEGKDLRLEYGGERVPGAGLAANQVGCTIALIIAVLENGGEPTVMINPKITERSPELAVENEGCLSTPKFYTTISRHRQITVQYQDIHFLEQERVLGGFEARVVQHECDHLEGTLVVDRLSRQQRRQAERLVDAHMIKVLRAESQRGAECPP